MAAQLLPTSYTEKTYGASGADYSSLAAWWAARCAGVNMVAASSGEVLTCSAGVYNDYLATSACTTSEAYFPCVRAASGAQGTPTSGVRFEVASAVASVTIMLLGVNYMTVTGIAAKATCTLNNGYAIGFSQYRGTTGTKSVSNVAYSCVAATGANAYGVGYSIESNGSQITITCAALDCTGNLFPSAGFYIQALTGNSTVSYLYGATATGNKVGLMLANGTAGTTLTVNSKNCIFQDNTTNIAVYPNPGHQPITHNQTTNQTSGVTFAADGYHLAAATNNGTDLRTDATFNVTTDIDGDTYKTTPSIGCDQFNTAPSAPSNPTPADTATGVAAGDVTLECDVTDDDGDAMTVTFYDASDDSLIGTDAAVASGGTATVTWAGRAAGIIYTWYAKANDGIAITTGPDWTFTTASGNNIFNFNMDLGISL